MKILKNNTALDILISDTGVTLLASSNLTIPPQDYLLFAASSDIVPLVSSGDIIVNDGVDDILIISDAIKYLYYPDNAENIVFNNLSNGFTSKTVQKAIEESLNSVNFSFHKIDIDKSVIISENQHMICTSVEIDGFLDVDGGVVFL